MNRARLFGPRAARGGLWLLPLIVVLCTLYTPLWADGQDGGPPPPPVTLAPGVFATIRFSETLVVPRKEGPGLRVRTELGTWRLQSAAREIAVPAQGFYVAELRNGDVTTSVGVGGKEQLRHTGDIWTVAAGQTMIVKLVRPVQQNAMLRILSLAPVD